ncbi:MAG: AMP-binding protein [bacterium]|nr:AMP-binding protein [bacterium]
MSPETLHAMSQPSTLVDILRWRAHHQADRRAYDFLVDGERRGDCLTYGELDERARAIGALLQQEFPSKQDHGANAAGRRLLLLYAPGLDFVAGFLGCLYAGAIAVPASPPSSKRHLPRLRSMLEDARPDAVLTTSAVLARIKAAAKALPSLAATRWLKDLAAAWQAVELDREDTAFLQYTSGSTATPKGVVVSHGNLMHNEELIRRAFDLTADAVIVGWLPLYHDMGLIGNVLQPLYAGARCVLMSPVAFLRKPVRWLEAISRYRGTTSGGPNFAYDLCYRKVTRAQRAQLDLSSWRVAFNGSEPVRAATMERFGELFAPCGFQPRAFYPCYGMAEATLMVTGGDPGREPVIANLSAAALERHRVVAATAEDAGLRLVSCGRSRRGQKLRIVEPEKHTVCADDQVGEIWLAGSSVAHGYWNRPQAGEQVFRARLADGDDAEAFLRTGDLGFLRRGELFVTGRLKDLIIIRGRNHYPQDIELTAEESHRCLRPACSAAFAIDRDGEERLVVVLEVERRPEDDLEVIAETVRRAVAEAHQVQLFEVVLIRAGTVLKTSSGKIRRHACRGAYLDGELTVLSRSVMAPDAGIEVMGAELEISRQALVSLDRDDQMHLLVSYLADHFARLTRTALAAIDRRKPLTAQGLDSLTAVELKTLVDSHLEVCPIWKPRGK